MTDEDDDILIIPPIKPIRGRPKDPNVEKRKQKNLELQERRIQLKELLYKMKEVTQADDIERTELLKRACDSLEEINKSLRAISAAYGADVAIRAGIAAKGKVR